VRYVLEGSVRRVGEPVEINAQLISTETGAHVWADRFEGERSNLGKLQFEVVARLANSLGAELVKAEVLREERERSGNPDVTDLTMRGWAIVWNFNGANKSSWSEAIAMFERALALDPKNASAITGLATALFARPYAGWSDNPAGDIARADKAADAALALRPDDSEAHFVKALLFERKSQMREAIAEAETAIADDPNNARAIAMASYYRMFLGHAEDGVAGQETALRLSPHDPMAPIWQVHLCYLYNHLAQWEQSIEWCERALANNVKERGEALAALAAASAWAGHDGEAKKAVAELRKVDPDFTVQTLAGQHLSDDPTFTTQRNRVIEGLRKAGLPEK
jgi:adenylate cyclase